MDSNNVKLLVVDDMPTVRESLQYYFAQEGYIVFTAASAEEALPIIKKDQPDIMLADITLPQMSGIELLNSLVSEWEEARVFIYSAHAEYKDRHLLTLYPNVRGFFCKSDGMVNLIKAINEEFE